MNETIQTKCNNNNNNNNNDCNLKQQVKFNNMQFLLTKRAMKQIEKSKAYRRDERLKMIGIKRRKPHEWQIVKGDIVEVIRGRDEVFNTFFFFFETIKQINSFYFFYFIFLRGFYFVAIAFSRNQKKKVFKNAFTLRKFAKLQNNCKKRQKNDMDTKARQHIKQQNTRENKGK